VFDNLRDNGTLIASGDGNSSIVGTVGRSVKIYTSGSSTSVGRGVFSCNGTNSATTSDSGSSRALGSTMTEGS